MRTFLLRLCFLLGVTLAAACGGEDTSCSSDNDCAAPNQCVWVRAEARVVGRMCMAKCSADTECPAGQTCTGTATSCPECKDFTKICE